MAPREIERPAVKQFAHLNNTLLILWVVAKRQELYARQSENFRIADFPHWYATNYQDQKRQDVIACYEIIVN